MMNFKNDKEGIVVDKMIGIYSGKERLQQGDVAIMPVDVFLRELFNGNVF